MNIQSMKLFDDGGNLTSEKLIGFRNKLRPVGAVQKTQEATAPVIESIQKAEEKKVQVKIYHKPLRGKPQAKKRAPLPKVYVNRPLPTPSAKNEVDRKGEEKRVSTEKKNLTDKRVIKEVKAKKPGFFTRSVHAIGNFAKKVFYGIKDFFEAVFGKLFGRVTKIKVGGKEITFDGHTPSKMKSAASLKVDLDPVAANAFKGITTLGTIAANTLPPSAPPLPSDGVIPVKGWRKDPKVEEKKSEKQTTALSIKEIVEKRRLELEQPQNAMFDHLSSGLAELRNASHHDDSDDTDDDDSFFEVTFTREDGKKTDLTFDGEKTVAIKTEIVDRKSRVYTGLSKKQGTTEEAKHINNNVLEQAMNKLKKVEKKDHQMKKNDQMKMIDLFFASIMRNAPHLLQDDE